MSMNKNFKAAVALVATGVLALSACGDDSASGGDGDGETVNYTAFSIMEAANEIVFEDFKETDAGDGVEFEGSYGPSGDQSRAVLAGADPLAWGAGLMGSIAFVGMDVHKATIAVAVVSGRAGTRPASSRRMSRSGSDSRTRRA